MRLHARLEAAALTFLLPFLSELKISWAFAAAPLHFQHEHWPLWTFGATIGAATASRVLMNALLTSAGDWLIAPILLMACAGAAAMLANPTSPLCAIVGIAAGHITDTAQVQASLCYRWRFGDPDAQKRALRLQAFSATFGYSSGALLGGAMYEHVGFRGCAILQVSLLCAMSIIAALLPVVHAAFRETVRGESGCFRGKPISNAPASAIDQPSKESELTLRGTNSRFLLLPVSLVWLSDAANISAYICEWCLFAVYFRDVYNWSSTLTGAAQMAGDLLAAAILALTTTRAWARLLTSKLRSGGATRAIDRLLLQPPWNVCLFFLLYAVTFTMLAQPIFAVSVLGQVLMGSLYVFNKQAIQESYVILSHGSLPLFRTLEFVGSCSFNVGMALSSLLSVLAYEELGRTTPFYAIAVFSGGWSVVVAVFFGWRRRSIGKGVKEGFAETERALLERLLEARRVRLTVS